MQLKATAPGSFMLLGEYAVLYGKHAVVCAVNKRITVTLTPREDESIEIQSALLGHYATTLSQLIIEKPFQFVLGVLKHYQHKLKRGCHIEITSDFSDKVGLGSSAAVTVATLAALVSWLNIKMQPQDVVRQGRNIVRTVQGSGSGADVAASVYGGIVAYQAQPLSIEKIAVTHPITALYAGFKTPTVEAIQKVQQHFASHPNLFLYLCHTIGQCSLSGIHALRKEQWKHFGEVMNIQQGLMESLGVNMPILRDMIDDLRRQPGILGAKISGSGMGDCVIGLGDAPDIATLNGVQRIPVEITLQGVQCEKI